MKYAHIIASLILAIHVFILKIDLSNPKSNKKAGISSYFILNFLGFLPYNEVERKSHIICKDEMSRTHESHIYFNQN